VAKQKFHIVQILSVANRGALLLTTRRRPTKRQAAEDLRAILDFCVAKRAEELVTKKPDDRHSPIGESFDYVHELISAQLDWIKEVKFPKTFDTAGEMFDWVDKQARMFGAMHTLDNGIQ